MVEAGINIVAASLAVRFIPFRRLAARLSARSNPRPCPAGQANLLGRALEAWSRRLPWRAKCFEKGLAAHWMLSRRDFASTLHYGAATIEGELKAHVWVTSGEIPITGCENRDDFALIARYPDD
ncbi:MAG: lasso peptide biosynthesis B2 protein [Pseudomonadota bacterium]|nr:lasso peptide biosynthesis B2 protein [Pseudomonadota bacterium]